MATATTKYANCELRIIGLENDALEKQVAILQQKLDELSMYSKLCKQSNFHYCKLRDDTTQKTRRCQQEIEQVTKEIKSLIDSSTAQVNLMIQKLEKYENLELKTLDLQKLFDFPYDEMIAKMEKEIQECHAIFKVESEKEANLNKEIEELTKAADSISRDIQKSRDNLIELDNLVTLKNSEVEKKISDSHSTNEERTRSLLKILEDLENSNITQQAEIEKAEKEKFEIDNQLLELEKAETERKKVIEDINKTMKEIENIEDITEDHRELFKDDEEMMKLYEQCLKSEDFEKEDDQEIEQLKKEIEALKESREQLEEELRLSLDVKTRHDKVLDEFNMRSEEVQNLETDLEEYQGKIDEHQKALEPSLKQNSSDFRTPDLVVRKKSKTLTVDSGFQHVSHDPFAYPGIQRISSSLKRKLDEEELNNPNNLMADSFQSSIDSSLFSSDSGTTADGSLMGGMFSPLKNAPIQKEKTSPEMEDFEEFSMMDHFKEFTGKRRRSVKEKGRSVIEMEKMLKENRMKISPDSDLTSKSSDDTILVSSFMDEEETVNEIQQKIPEEYEEDGDDSIMANDSELDQSVWSSDF
ncbi:unnamed protein product [Caenorhabditis angaria]|uniref:Uncharacterized protein n=1 Tax=Caenorhabditis angaria TaxID=860376 RepID=A0A9P1N545_9PELO|nr:unnamed protein product [Caenorhabditis angaria]